MLEMKLESLTHEFPSGSIGVGSAAVLEVELVVGGWVEAGEEEGVALLVGNGAPKSVDDAVAVRWIPILDGIPMFAVGARRDMKEKRIADERTQFFFVKGDGPARGVCLLRRPL